MNNFEIDGIFNLRDVGGLPTSDGGRIQSARLFRSGSPDRITDDGARRLHAELGLRTVIDLRHPDELSDSPTRGPLIADHITRHHISPVSTEQGMAEYVDSMNIAYGRTMSPERYFVGFRRGAARYAEAARLLSESTTYPVLIHCTAGKDRTGILTGLLLAVAGVAVDDIAAEYAASNASIDSLIAYLRESGRDLPEPDEELRARMEVKAEMIHGFLALVGDEFGDARGFFTAQGLSEAELDAVRSGLVDV
jgi:protein-tyrosine phosphatase